MNAPLFNHRKSNMEVSDESLVAPELRTGLQALRDHLNNILLGKEEAIELVIACLLSGGHLLLDDLPGTGKTTLAKSLASSLGGKLARIQCTPDLLPTDITGFNLFNQKTREFEFIPGPVFADILLADELNRTTPRTQSALLEAMAERQVTIDNARHQLSKSFFVIATQNPLDSHGAYPLPEAQLDRFTMRLKIGYPSRSAQIRILEEDSCRQINKDPEASVLSLEKLWLLQDCVFQVKVHPRIREYLVDLVEATRNAPEIQLGVSPRGMIYWQRAAQAWALLHDRDFVTPSDIVRVGPSVLAPRIQTLGNDSDQVAERVFARVSAPEFK